MNINKIEKVIDRGETWQVTGEGINMSVPVNSTGSMQDIVQQWSEVEGNDIELYIEPEVNPQIAINAQERAYLSNTDWYIIRFQETGEAIPQTILDGRENARKNVIQ